jgi:hypothetical protein
MHLSRRPWLPVTRFCIPALSVALLSACGGSGSGDAPAVQAPVTGPDANLLMPIDTGVTYQYLNPLSPENDPEIFDITYGTVTSDFLDTPLNPLSFTLKVPGAGDEGMDVKEMITSSKGAVTLYGYSLENLPLSIIGLDLTEAVNMLIKPDVGVAIYTNQMALGGDPVALGFSSATISFTGLENDDIANIFLEVLGDDFSVFPFNHEQSVNALKSAINGFDLAGKGVPVNLSGTGAYTRAFDAAETKWGLHNDIESGVYTAHEVVFNMSITIGSADFSGFDIFSIGIDVLSTMQFVEGLGPILRQFDVSVETEIGAGTDTFDIGFEAVLDEVTEGDDNPKDYWLDSLGPKPAPAGETETP